ncbi:MAG: hypothetical protein LWW85_00745 [Marinilabiliales bacterium]|nr:hypothetical protein [Marinilabiliales bacterium]
MNQKIRYVVMFLTLLLFCSSIPNRLVPERSEVSASGSHDHQVSFATLSSGFPLQINRTEERQIVGSNPTWTHPKRFINSLYASIEAAGKITFLRLSAYNHPIVRILVRLKKQDLIFPFHYFW